MGMDPISFEYTHWGFAVAAWYLCGLPVGMPMLAGTLTGAVVRGASAKSGCGVGLLVGLASAPLTLVAELAIDTWAERRTDNATLLGLMVAVPGMLFAGLAAYLVWRRAVLPDIRYR